MKTLTKQDARELVKIGNKLSDTAALLKSLNYFLEVGIDSYGGYTKEDSRDMHQAIEVILRISSKSQVTGIKELY